MTRKTSLPVALIQERNHGSAEENLSVIEVGGASTVSGSSSDTRRRCGREPVVAGATRVTSLPMTARTVVPSPGSESMKT